jgi:hypothetical protein
MCCHSSLCAAIVSRLSNEKLERWPTSIVFMRPSKRRGNLTSSSPMPALRNLFLSTKSLRSISTNFSTSTSRERFSPCRSLAAAEGWWLDRPHGLLRTDQRYSGLRSLQRDEGRLRSFVRTWTSDLKDRHIRSNVISPGPIDTPAIDGLPAEAVARIVSTIPMGRMGESDEIAKAALFLVSDDSSFVTGIELFVDGGTGQI